ncbi:hypothetical protein F0U44_17000 [Nocardioides humilatus]|uniref:Uncharacterized protein n=1 Tax=Nocardioides humilatus TaxID=2607660 RepID=A0A5B1L9A1_9ACTN|nr:hypothetical protein [Nocardioides humilatus]KAA1416884.1 hypothetical protein F0U44_17000 [Nocardioides humilatus]
MPGRMITTATLLAALVAAQFGHARADVAAAKPPQPGRGMVADSMWVGTTVAQADGLAVDVDGDGDRDNAMGRAMAALSGAGLAVDDVLAADLAHGDIVMLHSLRTASLADSNAAHWQVWYGDPTPDPDLSGAGTFVLPSDQLHSRRLAAVIQDHIVKTVPGRVPVRLDFGTGPFRLRLTKAVIAAKCFRRGCIGGQINGGISAARFDAIVVPKFAEFFQVVVDRDCPGPGPASCSGPGATVQQLFDADDDLVVTADELRSNALFSGVFLPDVDLVGADGLPGSDGVNDGISVAVGFTTAQATLVSP